MNPMFRGRYVLFPALLVSAALVLAGPVRAQDVGDPAAPDGAEPAAEPAEPTARAPAITDPAVRDEAIERLIGHYLETYGKQLKSPDWMARAMGVVGLSRVDDPRFTTMLLETLDGDKLPVVRVFAWEALHSRLGSLSPEQRAHWLTTGKTLLAKGYLRGDLQAGLLRAVIPEGPTDENRKLFRYLFEHTNSMDSSDRRTLDAMRDALGVWRNRTLISELIGVMDQLHCVFRAQYVLGYTRLNAFANAETLAKEGTQAMAAKIKEAWQKTFDGAGEDIFQGEEPEPYNGPSLVMPAAERIDDPGDPKWRKDLELTRFTLDHLDVALAVDSTGSMTTVIRWVQRDVTKLMRAFHLISYEPRLSVIFYRDLGDAYIVKPYPFTANADALAKAIKGVEAKGGGDEPEAVYEALMTAVTKQKWSSGDFARRVVVLVGDAPPHKESMAAVEKLVTKAAGEAFHFFCLKVRGKYTAGNLGEFDQIAEWGKGASFWAEFYDDPFPDLEQAGAVPVRNRVGILVASGKMYHAPLFFDAIAEATRRDGPCHQLMQQIVRTAVPKVYDDKVEPFVNTMLEFLEQYIPEKRQAFGPLDDPPLNPRGPRRRDPEKPFDPQAR